MSHIRPDEQHQSIISLATLRLSNRAHFSQNSGFTDNSCVHASKHGFQLCAHQQRCAYARLSVATCSAVLPFPPGPPATPHSIHVRRRCGFLPLQLLHPLPLATIAAAAPTEVHRPLCARITRLLHSLRARKVHISSCHVIRVDRRRWRSGVACGSCGHGRAHGREPARVGAGRCSVGGGCEGME